MSNCIANRAQLLLGIVVPLSVILPAPTLHAQALVLASVDARWEQVYCDLTELKRTATGELNVRFRYRNSKPTPHPLPHVNLVAHTLALDPASSTLFGVLEDAAGETISSSNLDGMSSRPIPAAGSQAHWVRLQAPPPSAAAVTVLVEGCLPFEDVVIGMQPAMPERVAPAPAIGSQDGNDPGVVVELTGVNRQAGEFVTVTFRFRNTGSEVFGFPHARSVRAMYLLDNAARRKYEVVRDQREEPLCSETLGLHSQSGDMLGPGEAMTFWAMLPSPPADTGSVSVFVPYAPPFDDVAVTGAGGGSAAAGAAVAGAVMGVDAALQELDAVVSESRIRIDLAADVLFDFDKADIRPAAEQSLRNVATVLKAHSGARVVIEGHTDSKGADDYNQTLSEQRAASVRQWLAGTGGVDGAAITTRGWGATRPVAHNTRPDGSDDPDGRMKNRRVEITVTTKP